MREEEKKRSSQISKFFKKRWVFPAVYLVSAALLISMLVWYQQSGTDTVKDPKMTDEGKDVTGKAKNPVMEVNRSFETVAMPVKNEDNVEYVTQFFDPDASAEEQAAALIVDGTQYRPNMGLDIAMKDGKDFEVLAALSGKVITVRQDTLLGNVIEIEHEKGILTVYQSVKDFKVKVGDEVKQGQAIATSGTSQLNKEAKIHVHFEIRKDNEALNPLDYFGQPFTALEGAPSEQDEMSGQLEKKDGKEASDESDTEETDMQEHSNPSEDADGQ
ncbi:MAG TPA: M23 family metallopeptidase [Bacillaceae bacterium]